MLEAVRDEFVEQQAQRHSEVQPGVDRRHLEHQGDAAAVGPIGAGQLVAQVAHVVVEADRAQGARLVQALVHQRHGAYPVGGLGQGALGATIPERARLQVEQADDQLQIVLDPVVQLLEQGALVVQRLAQRFLLFPAGADVAHGHDQERTLGQRIDHGVGRKGQAVLAQAAQVGGAGHAAPGRGGPHALVHRGRRRPAFHQQRIQRQPFQRAGGVAEHALGLDVGAGHPAAGTDQEDAARGLFEDPAQEGFAALDRALGFAQHPFGVLGLVALDGAFAQQRRGLDQGMADVQRLVQGQRRQHHLFAVAEGDGGTHQPAQRRLDAGADQRHQRGPQRQQAATAHHDAFQRAPQAGVEHAALEGDRHRPVR